jgi:hypothetical protein
MLASGNLDAKSRTQKAKVTVGRTEQLKLSVRYL